jgi:DNA-binding response OmpR family regulator
MDGYEIVQVLRRQNFAAPIIALTAGAMVGDREKCLRAGFDGYLTKPIDRRQLVALVAQLCRRGPSGGEKTEKPRVLLVDDSHNACKFLTLFLEKRGYQVRSAHDGASAIDAAREFRPAIVVLDIRLPDMDGIHLMEELKELDAAEGARFIGLSGYPDAWVSGSGKFDYYLEKPLDTAKLEFILREIGH